MLIKQAFDTIGGEDDDGLAFSPARTSTPPPKKRSDPFILFSSSKKDKHGDYDHDDDGDWKAVIVTCLAWQIKGTC